MAETSTIETTPFDPETAEPGTVIHHTSEEGGPPDVAYQVILAKGESLWIGEITRDRYEDAGGDAMGLGGDGGWWLIHYKGADATVLGKAPDRERAGDLADLVAGIVRRAVRSEEMADKIAEASLGASRAMAGAIGEIRTRERTTAERLALLLDPPRYRHVKRGTTYRLLARGGEVQTSRPIVEGDKLTSYVGEDGKVWHRLDEEFADGRFEEIKRGNDDGA